VENIIKLYHSRDILVCVDAIQAIGAIPYDVHSLGCDFLSCGGRKWIFGPVGSGFLYIKKDRMEELFLSEVGWHSAQNINFDTIDLEFAHSARRFEPGCLDIPAIAAMAASVHAMKKIGWEKIHQRIAALTKILRNKWKDFALTPAEHGGIITLQIPKAAEIQKKLLEQNIIVTQRGDKLRISVHASVLDKELSTFSEALSYLM
jgi:selenocysteine lyase/cysteine desulfurase